MKPPPTTLISKMMKELKLLIAKAEQRITEAEKHILPSENHHADAGKIAVKFEEEAVLYDISNIVRCEADGAYTDIYFINITTTKVSQNIKKFEEKLAAHDFLRVHDKHLINPEYILKIGKEKCPHIRMADGSTITASRRGKKVLKGRF